MIRRIVLLSVLFLSRAPLQANEQSDKRLAEVLQPNVAVGLLPGNPKAFPERKLIVPGFTLAKFQGRPPRPELWPAQSLRPLSPAEPAPLVTIVSHPVVPSEIALPTVALAAFAIVDVNVPPLVPILGRPTPDRAPLTDATLEASIAAALGRAIPLRALTVPFFPMNLPDPFELQYLIRLQNPLAEDFQPSTGPMRILVKPPEPAKAPTK